MKTRADAPRHPTLVALAIAVVVSIALAAFTPPAIPSDGGDDPASPRESFTSRQGEHHPTALRVSKPGAVKIPHNPVSSLEILPPPAVFFALPRPERREITLVRPGPVLGRAPPAAFLL